MIAAGSFTVKGAGVTARDCLSLEARPTTPPEIRKYRRSTNLEPGKRFTHHGIADDLNALNLSEKKFGMNTQVGAISAADLISHSKPSELDRINQLKAERTYKAAKREKLGKTVERDTVLPAKFTQEDTPFGCVTRNTEPAKDIIFPRFSEEMLQGEDLYIRSHGSYGPGEQKSRNYQWPVDPNSVRFGAKGDVIAFNGVSTNIADILRNTDDQASAVSVKKVEDIRSMGDLLGRSRNLGQNSGSRPMDSVYGKPTMKPGKSGWGAAEIMRGRYTEDDQQPDPDLGKSITPGFRNISVENRTFGCPSVRTDLPQAAASGRRSMADSQNYGDDPSARELISPAPFSELALTPTTMSEPRSKENLLALFSRIGYPLDQRTGDALFARASGGSSGASINAFRSVLNEYLQLQDMKAMRK